MSAAERNTGRQSIYHYVEGPSFAAVCIHTNAFTCVSCLVHVWYMLDVRHVELYCTKKSLLHIMVIGR